MATRLSRATGNWTSASTWALVDATSFTGTTSEGTTNALTTTYAASTTFTPGAITIDAIAVRLANRAGTTGTISIALDQAATTVPGTEVTINVADLPQAITASLDGGWIVFKFAAPVSLAAATLYSVKGKTSTVSMVSLHTVSGTNWARMLRTTTQAAPAAGDDLHIAGEFTAAGVSNSLTVTMDQTAATDYGSAPTAVLSLVTPGVGISSKGTLSFSSASAANPLLRLSNSLVVYNGGTLAMGTTGTPIPRDSRAILEFDQLSADGDYGLIVRNGGTFNGQGLSRSAGKNVVSCKLAADAVASGAAPSTSTLTVDIDTGWLAGDQIAVAATSRTPADAETGTLDTNAGASSMTVKNMTAAAVGMAVPPTSNRGLLVAHSGIAPTQAEIILITRNVVIRSTSATLMAYVNVVAGGIVDLDWVEFYYLGENVANKRGIEIAGSTTLPLNFDMQYCSIHDCEDNGVFVSAAAAILLTKLLIAYCTMWNLGMILGPGFMVNSAITPTNWTIDNNIQIRTINNNCFEIRDIGGTFTNNTAVSSVGNGIAVNEGSSIVGTFSGNVAHANGGSGIVVSGAGSSGVLASCAAWRNSSVAAGFTVSGAAVDLLVTDLICFGNAGNNVLISALGSSTRFVAPVLNGDTSFSTTIGFNINQPGGVASVIIDDGDFGTVSGIKTTHTQDIVLTGALCEPQIILRNTKLGSNVEMLSPNLMTERGYISSQKQDRIAGRHQTWMRHGRVETDTSIYRTASPSMRISPLMASNLLISNVLCTVNTSQNFIVVPPHVGDWVQIGDWIMTSLGFTAGARVTAVNPNTLTVDRLSNAFSTSSQLTLYRGKVPSAPQGKGFQIAADDGQTHSVGVWVRKQQENVFLYSEDYSQVYWTASGSTLTAGQADWAGGTSASQFLETSVNVATHGLSFAAVTIALATYVWSFYVKGGLGRQWLRIEEGSGPRSSWIDVTNGVVGTANAAHTISLTDAGGGWYRVAVAFVANSTSWGPKLYTATGDGLSATFVGDPTKGFLTGAWQTEFGTGPTPYQITTFPGIAGYDGNQPRLMQRANPAIGIANDIVIDTMSVANGEWEQLTGTTTAPSGDAGVIELYVDCDGMTGWINVDDFTVA